MNAQLTILEQTILKAQKELTAKQQLAGVLSETPLADKTAYYLITIIYTVLWAVWF